jgi:hypothetical protein
MAMASLPSRTGWHVMTCITRSCRSVVRFLRQRRPALRWNGVDDPRAARGKRFTLAAMLNTVVLAFMSGANTIRMAAGNASRFGAAMRRVAEVCGCGRSAIGGLLARLDALQLRLQLVALIVGEWYRKALVPDRLPLGLAAIDGKALYSDRQPFHPGCQDQDDKDSDKAYPGHRTWVLRVLRAALVSCSSCPVIDQRVIPAKTNEMGFFAAFLRGLLEAYGRLGLIQAVSVDAGMVSLANANLVCQAGLQYIFRLKEGQVELWREATRLLAPLAEATSPEYETGWQSDSARGLIKRQLWRTADMAGWNGWTHLAQVWLVRTVKRQHDGSTQAIEHRYYLTSLNWRRLAPAQILDAVRCHWGIENNAHGTADIAFDEDHSPCSTTGRGIECSSLLRLIAINLCQLFRHRRFRGKAGKTVAWQLLRADIFIALCLPAVPDDTSGP